MRKKIPLVSLKMIREKSLPRHLDEAILSADDAYKTISELIKDKDRECFVVIGTNHRNIPNYVEIASIGTSREAIVDVKEILKAVLLTSSSKLFLAHNHPSGSITPSDEDLIVTERIKKAANLFGITIVDHLIVTNEKYYSFKEDNRL